jgi:TfdA family taurine catabolism dioxygenase TauD
VRSATNIEGTSAEPLVSVPAPWYGRELAGEDTAFTHVLTEAEIEVIDGAIESVTTAGLALPAVDRTTFPLPALDAATRAWEEEVRSGRGFVVIRGLPVERWTTDEARIAFLGLGQHLGAPMGQNARGDFVADVRAERAAGDPSTRRYETSQETPYHTDGSDMIALFCLKQGRSGGQSSLVSSVAVINEVHRARPDLVPLVFEPWPFAMTADATDHFAMPLVAALEPFSLFYIRWYIEQSLSQSNVAPLTADQRALLDLIDAIAADPGVHLDIDFRPGDIQLVSNRTVMHARATFVDWAEPERRRHLLRLWLAHTAG